LTTLWTAGQPAKLGRRITFLKACHGYGTPVRAAATNPLESFVHKLEDAGTRVSFAGAAGRVRQALVMAGLRKPHVHYAATVEAAVAHWPGGEPGP
jgi:hypothetical protein